MTEKQRQKVLLGILGTAVGAWLLIPAFQRTFVKPVTDLASKKKAAEKRRDDAQEDQITMMQAQAQLSQWKDSSLPPDPLRAQDVYKNWARKLAIRSGFVDLTVEPGRRSTKQDVYESVQVTVEGTANLKQVRAFLYRFYKTDLTHRITRLVLVNDDNESALADMEVTIDMEGLCMVGSEPRSELFPSSDVEAEVAEDATSVVVESAKDFPTEAGFLCTMNNEIVRVAEVNGNEFTIERALDGTSATEHPADSTIELLPVNKKNAVIQIGDDGRFVAVADTDAAKALANQYNDLVESGMFTKPRPPIQYKPRLASIGDRTIARGKEFKITARLSGTDPDQGKAVFELAEGAPAGMEVNAETGAVIWTTDEKVEPGKYEAKVLAWQQQNPDTKLEEEFVVTVEVPNDKPVLTVEDKKEAYIGGSLVVQASATDDGDAADLTFTMDKAPAGAAINPSTGELTWDLPTDMSPGDYKVEVTVTDAGDQKATKTVTLTALDDVAKYTSVTGFVDDEKPSFWLYNKLTGKQHTVHVGDSFQVADIEAEVVEIDFGKALIRTSKGLWKLSVGETVRSMVLVEAAKQVEPPTEAPASPSDATKAYEGEVSADKDTKPDSPSVVDPPTVATPTSVN